MNAVEGLWRYLKCQNNPCTSPNPAGPGSDTSFMDTVIHLCPNCRRKPRACIPSLKENNELQDSCTNIYEGATKTSLNNYRLKCPDCRRNPCTCCRICCTTPCCCGIHLTQKQVQLFDWKRDSCARKPESEHFDEPNFCPRCHFHPCRCNRPATIEEAQFCSQCGQYPCRCGPVRPSPGRNEEVSFSNTLDDYDCLGCGKPESTCVCGCIWLVVSS